MGGNHKKSIVELEKLAYDIRIDIIKMLEEAGSGHSAGPLGLADIMTTLYFDVLNHDPKRPNWQDRDMFVMSNGHCNPVLYATLAHAGYFEKSELMTLRKFGSRLQGHPERLRLPGLETTSGPLGSGLSQASGMALALKMDKQTSRFVYCVTSDGEHDEGNTWEAVMFSAKYKLNNLVNIIDRNYIQIDGPTEDVMPLDQIADKYKAFGWQVLEVGGHNIQALINAFSLAKAEANRPTVIVARTIPGRGVDFMENNYHWHGMPVGIADIDGAPPKKDQAKVALKELRSLRGKLTGEYE